MSSFKGEVVYGADRGNIHAMKYLSSSNTYDPITVQEALQTAGGVTPLCNILCCTRMSIYNWVKKGELPELYRYRYLAWLRQKEL